MVEAIQCALIFFEGMHDHVNTIDQHPAAFAFDGHARDFLLFAEAVDFFDDGMDLAITATADDDHEVSKAVAFRQL